MTMLTSMVVLLFLYGCDGARILVLPADHSEVNMFAMAGKAAMDSGHDVWLLTTLLTIEAAGLNPILKAPSEKSDIVAKAFTISEKLWAGGNNIGHSISMLDAMSSSLCEYVHEILEDKDLMKDLTSLQIDLVIADATPFYRCSYMIPYYLDVPYLSIMAGPVMWITGVTNLPSVEPNIITGFTNHMTFPERIVNTISYLAVSVLQYYLLGYSQNIDEVRLGKLFQKDPPVSLQFLHDNSLMWLVNFEPVCFDYPRVSTPSYQYMGGTSAQLPKPLTKDISHFIETVPNGVIVMTFGSVPGLDKMPTEMLNKFISAFARLDQRVIVMQKEHKLKNIPANVKIMKWVPQNDILGHHNTKLFITHGGNNGQMEALYHAVPMLVMPVSGDQKYSANRAVVKGYGKTLNLQAFTSDELYETIIDILSDKNFHENIKNCSRIVKSIPSPAETVSFWVNHVLQFGGKHLHNPGRDMPLYQLFCIDILLFFQAVIIIMCTICFYCCRCLLRQFAKRGPYKKTKSD